MEVTTLPTNPSSTLEVTGMEKMVQYRGASLISSSHSFFSPSTGKSSADLVTNMRLHDKEEEEEVELMEEVEEEKKRTKKCNESPRKEKIID